MSKPNLTPLEADEAHTLMQYMQARGLKFTHVKNETGVRDKRGEIRNFRAMMDAKDGVSPGFPDFVIVLPNIGLLCIELKRLAGNEATPAQLQWIDALNTVPGVEAHVCKGAAASIKIIEQFMPLHSHVSKKNQPPTTAR
jgi:hypothetical protein